MLSSLLLAAALIASPDPAVKAPARANVEKPAAAAASAVKAPAALLVIETKRGKLEFSHQQHAKTACADCHKGQAVPGRFGLKGKTAAHGFCVNCHKATKQGPQKCTSCHER